MVTTLVIADEVASNLSERTLRDLAPELVLSAGDLPWDYVEWVTSTVSCPVVYVPGNHDGVIEVDRDDAYGGVRPLGVIHADVQVVRAAGLTIAGLGGCVRYRPGPHQYSQRQYAGRARTLLRRARRTGPVDVLLTHTPPLGLGDGDDRPHVGIAALHRVIERLEPTEHVHGHIHPYGMQMPDRSLGRTTIRNVIPWRVLEVTPRESAESARSA